MGNLPSNAVKELTWSWFGKHLLLVLWRKEIPQQNNNVKAPRGELDAILIRTQIRNLTSTVSHKTCLMLPNAGVHNFGGVDLLFSSYLWLNTTVISSLEFKVFFIRTTILNSVF